MKAISFLGFNQRKGYDKTIYISPDGSDQCETEFFQEAMVKFYKPKVLYILLTKTAETGIPNDRTESNWDALQKRLAGKVELQPVKNVPESSSPEELWGIFSLLTEYLQEDDQVLFDITYGFRFLPIVALIAVSYLRVVRNVKINGLIYGAFNAQNEETNQTPIFDLLPIVSLLEWTTATDQFLKTGNGQALAGLLHNGDTATEELANNIDEIAKALQLLRPMDVMEEAALLPKNIKTASEIVSQSLPPFTTLLKRVENDYGNFGLSNPEEYKTNAKASLVRQLRMIEWYVNKDQVVQALSLAREWLPSLLCYYFKLDPRQQVNREDMEKLLKASTHPTAQLNLVRDLPHLKQWSKVPQSKKEKLRQLWKGKYNLTKLRNDVLHAGCGEDPELAVDILDKTKDIFKELKEVAFAWNILL